MGTDWDAAAVQTARQNEKLNFATSAIRWQKMNVQRLSGRKRYELVLANLFSGILCEAAPKIAAAVAPGGQLWLSGILRTQQEEVSAAYEAHGLQLNLSKQRGRWIMLQWRKPSLVSPPAVH